MTPVEKLAAWTLTGFGIGTLAAWATDCSLLRIVAWACVLAFAFGAAYVVRIAIEAADHRAYLEEQSYRGDLSPTRSRNDAA